MSEEHPGDIFLRFVKSFTPESRPDFVLLTGGEPLLRPDLVSQIAAICQEAGSQVSVATGMFFARSSRIPKSINRAIDAVDAITVSMDEFHEKEVPRRAVFDAIHQLLAKQKDVHLQITVDCEKQHPYLTDLLDEVHTNFGRAVPALVTSLGAAGRAKEWLTLSELGSSNPVPSGCQFVSWPVVGYKGTVAACCNQDAVDQTPPHLRLGHASTDSWCTVRERAFNSMLLSAIRIFGPQYVASEFGKSRVDCDGYCSTCLKLSQDQHVGDAVYRYMKGPSGALLHKVARLVDANSGATILNSKQYGTYVDFRRRE